MPSSMRYPCEPFVPQGNGFRAPASQQQEEMPARNGSRTLDLQQPVTMPATNGDGKASPSISETDGSITPTPPQQQQVQPQRIGSGTHATQQQQEIPTQNGYHGMSSAGSSSHQPPHQYPPFMNFGTQMYIRFEEAARFFTPQNGNAAPHPPHPPQPNGHYGNRAPHVNGNNGSFPPQPNGYGDHGFMNGEFIFRARSAPLPYMLPPGFLPGRFRTGSLSHPEYVFPLPPYYGPETHQYYTNYQYPTPDKYYYPNGPPPYPNVEFTPLAPLGPRIPPANLREKTSRKLDDPEAKLFVGDLPVRMSTEDLCSALKKRFSRFGECKVNVTWKVKRGPDVAERWLPTGWVQYRTPFEAAMALDTAKKQCFAIGNRPVRVDLADGKRICRVWPSHPRARPNLEDFRNLVRHYVHHAGVHSAYRILYHLSDRIEMVEKEYGGQSFTVPSIGVVFRWVEDALYSQQRFPEFTQHFRLKIEHVNSGTPDWREGPVSLRRLDALILDTGEKWQGELILSRRCLQEKGEISQLGKMARYPERISRSSIPRSILEHPRLKKDILVSGRLEWLDLHQERPTPRAMAVNTKKMRQVNGQRNGHSNGGVNHLANGKSNHTNGEATHQTNGDASHQTNW